MGRTLGENPMGPLPGSVDKSGVWNTAATEHQSSNAARNPQPHSKLEKSLHLTNIIYAVTKMVCNCRATVYCMLRYARFYHKTLPTINVILRTQQ